MVDFNNAETVGTPALDIVRVLVLERRYNIMEAFEEYKKVNLSGVDDLSKEIGLIQSRLLTFYFEIQAVIERHLTKEEKEKIIRALDSEKFSELFEAFVLMNGLLDKLTITKLDTRQALPPMSRPELRNQAKGR